VASILPPPQEFWDYYVPGDSSFLVSLQGFEPWAELFNIENIVGSSFGDTLIGTSGNNMIQGGGGADSLTGGADNDTFVFAAVADSIVGVSDTITDFVHGADLINFANIAGIDSFEGQVSGGIVDAHSIGWSVVGGTTHVYVNTTAAGEAIGAAQMEIVLTGNNLGLTATDFLFV
jgi:Ca2+-binding RTX toxin-like protein